jgi:hypothetical protein
MIVTQLVNSLPQINRQNHMPAAVMPPFHPPKSPKPASGRLWHAECRELLLYGKLAAQRNLQLADSWFSERKYT